MRSPLFAVAVVLTLAFGYVAVRDARLGEMRAALGSSDYRWLVPATLVFGAAIALRLVRWRLLFHAESRPPANAAARALLVGYLLNNVLPLRAGEAARVVMLKRLAGTSRAESASTIVTERVYDVATLFVLLFAALFWLPDVGWAATALVVALALAFAIVATVVGLTRWRTGLTRLALRAARLVPMLDHERGERAVAALFRGAAGFTRKRTAGLALACSFASWGVMAASFWLVTLCFDLGLPPTAGLLVVIATSLSLALPSSPAGLGVFEAAVVVSLGAYDVPPAQALSYALVLHGMNVFPFVVAGLWALGPNAPVRHPDRWLARS